MANLFKYSIALFLILTSSFLAKAQYIEAEQCIGGEGLDEIYMSLKTKDGGTLLCVKTNSTTGDFPTFRSYYNIGLIKLNKDNIIEWKQSISDSVFGYSGIDISKPLTLQSIPSFTPIEDEGRFIIPSWLNDGSTNLSFNIVDYNGAILKKSESYKTGKRNEIFNYYIDTSNNKIYITDFKDSTFNLKCLNYNLDSIWSYSYVFQEDSIEKEKASNFFDCIIQNVGNNILVRVASYYEIIFPTLTTTKYLNIILDKDGLLKKISTEPNNVDKSAYGIHRYEPTEFISNNIVYTYKDYYTALDLQTQLFQFSIDSLKKIDSNITYNKYNKESYYLKETSDKFFHLTINKNSESDTLILQEIDKNNLNLREYIIDNSLSGTFSDINYTMLNDESVIIIYQKNNTLRCCKLDKNNHIIYNNFIDTVPTVVGNYTSLDNLKIYISNNSIFFMPVFNGSAAVYRQMIYQVDLAKGILKFKVKNNNLNKVVYKFIAEDEHYQSLALANSINCNLGETDILFQKLLFNSNKIIAKAFIDYNNDAIQNNSDSNYNLAYLESNKNQQTISTYMLGNNYTTNFVDTGIWQTKLIPTHAYYTINPVLKTTNHTDFGNSDTIKFALHPNQIIKDLKVALVNTFVTRLGRTATYEITCFNEGTHPTDGIVKLVLDNRLGFVSATPTISSQNGDTLIWNVTNLPANQFRKASITVNVPIPPITDIGDTLQSIVFVNPTIFDSTPNDNQAILNDIIIGAYDPNDKISTTGEDMSTYQIQNGDYITYIIRFQNVGNDTAFRVVVLDTLDANLDWSTLQPVNTSHPFSMQVINGNIVQFTFNNLLLPDSSINEDNSHGFIAYKIKPKSSLGAGAVIKNTAHIYFDFNKPIATGTVQTRVSLILSAKNNKKSDSKISVYPNPNNGIFNLDFIANYTSPLTIELYDVTGKICYQNQLQHQQKSIVQINTENLASGLYSVVLKTNQEQINQKIIVEK